MIKKTVVCDKCKKGKPWVIIPKSDKLESNTVLCKECAERYYHMDCSPKCTNCGISIAAGVWCEADAILFCSLLCAIQYSERHNGDDEQKARYFIESDENMLLGEDEQED